METECTYLAAAFVPAAGAPPPVQPGSSGVVRSGRPQKLD